MLTLSGHLTISRVLGGNSEEVRIEVIDDNACVVAIRIKATPLAFVEALFGSGSQLCVFEFNNTGSVGTNGENKEELVPVPPSKARDSAGRWITKALKPFEIDGWHARGGDIENFTHRHVVKGNKDFQRVVFFRNVPKVHHA